MISIPFEIEAISLFELERDSGQLPRVTWFDYLFRDGDSEQLMLYKGDIDVGDGCWRPNVLVTCLRCW